LLSLSIEKDFEFLQRPETLSKVQHLKEMGMTVLPLDIVDSLSIKTAVESDKEATSGTLDVLVNNAGIGEIN
jgi:1-acylglycerone phosphate reductase